MNYTDKNGSKWSIEKGDWVGSFEKNNSLKKRLTKFSIPVLFIVILSIILLS